MVGLAIGLAFLVCWISHGHLLLSGSTSYFAIQGLPAYQYFLLLAIANFWIPALVIYLLLRWTRAERWLCPGIRLLLALGNGIFIAMAALFVVALLSGRPGAEGFIYLGALGLLPAVAIFGIAFLWLVCRALNSDIEPDNTTPSLGRRDFIRLGVALAIPVLAMAALLLLPQQAPLKLAKQSGNAFRDRCRDAGEKIIETPADVESLYLEPDTGIRFARNGKGVYKAVSQGIVGQLLVDRGLLLFFEKKNEQQGGPGERYTKHVLGDWEGEVVDHISSEFGVFHRKLTTPEEESRLHLRGEEITVKNLKSGKVTAVLTYYTNSAGEICGPAKGVDPSIDKFLVRSLNLTQRFPVSPRYTSR